MLNIGFIGCGGGNCPPSRQLLIPDPGLRRIVASRADVVADRG